MAGGGRRPGAGRPKGSVNKVTAKTRSILRDVYEELAPEVKAWIRATAEGGIIQKRDGGEVEVEPDPKGAADLVLKLAEFTVPKLQRVTIDLKKLPLEEIAAELARREQENEPG